MKKIFILVLLVFSYQITQSQHNTIIIYDSRDYTGDKLFGYSQKINNVFVPHCSKCGIMADSVFEISPGVKGIHIPQKTPGTVFIADFMQHQLYVDPGDTVYIKLEKVIDFTEKIGNGFTPSWSVKYIYYGIKAPYHRFFDSLQFHGGPLHFIPVSVRQTSFDLNVFLDSANGILKDRMAYLELCKYRDHLNKEFVDFARKEIEYAHLLTIVNSLQFAELSWARGTLPKGLVSLLDSFDFNDTKYLFASAILSKLIPQYIKVWKFNYSNMAKDPIKEADEQLRFYQENFLDEPRRYFMGLRIGEEIYNGRLPSEKIFNWFRDNIGLETVYQELVSRYDHLKAVKNDISFVHQSQLLNFKGEKYLFSSLLGSKPLVVDVWASWCMPCIEQFPYMEKVRKKWEERVNFITISFDRDIGTWTKSFEKFNFKEEEAFFLPRNFESDFARYFYINSIPRYIVFDRNGTVKHKEAPHPINTNEWDLLMDELIK